MQASDLGYCDVVDTLIGGLANVDLRAVDGRAALSLASINGHRSVVEALLAAGAEPQAAPKTPRGRRAARRDTMAIRDSGLGRHSGYFRERLSLEALVPFLCVCPFDQ